MVVGSEWLLLSAAQREVKLEASSFTALRGSGLVSLQRNKKTSIPLYKTPAVCKKEKKKCVLLSGIAQQCTAP